MIPTPSFTIARHDELPTLNAVLLGASGEQVDISGATVTFAMRRVDGATVTLAGTASIVDATGGAVSYAWGAGDTATIGQYLGEFEVTFASGKSMTFPNSASKIVITIVGDINNA